MKQYSYRVLEKEALTMRIYDNRNDDDVALNVGALTAVKTIHPAFPSLGYADTIVLFAENGYSVHLTPGEVEKIREGTCPSA
jgi:hypothetical protein